MTKKSLITRHCPTIVMSEAAPAAPAAPVRAFPAAPNTSCYFASESAERARTTLVRCIDRMEGPALLIGSSGSGKSVVLAVLAEHFQSRLSVAALAGGILRTPRELHQGILYALGLNFRGMDEGELRLTLLQRLEEDDDSHEGVLLLVDEAQSLGVELMEELRMLTNVVRDGFSRVRLVLAGTPVLEDQLADIQLASLQQRIAVRCYLAEMSRAETKAYIQAHLKAARLDPELFTADAFAQIFDLTEGLPRLVNQLCDHALLLSQANARKPIDLALVEEAWSDVEQFPTLRSSRNSESGTAIAEDVLEFGSLSDPDDPGARIATMQEQLASINIESARGAPADDALAAVDDSVDFSLPDDDWPEVEVVLREASVPRANEFREEEVVADPFQRAAPIATQIWSPTPTPAIAGFNSGPRLFVEEEVTRDVPPLRAVPLMVHVQTNLFTPDPVWPDESVDVASSRPTGGSCRDQGVVSIDEREKTSREAPLQTANAPQPREKVDAAPPRRGRGPAQKKFAALFTSLKDQRH
jgi:type II secretory pathway predicted ATPase ExeA